LWNNKIIDIFLNQGNISIQGGYLDHNFESIEFENNFDTLYAIALKRLKITIKYQKIGDDHNFDAVADYLHQFGLTLVTIYRFRLYNALSAEVYWFGSLFQSHGWGRDLLASILESWIVAIEGIVKMPEATHLSAELRNVRKNLDQLSVNGSAASLPKPSRMVTELSDLLLQGEYDASRSLILKEIKSGLDVAQAVTQLILPAMRYIGSRWQNDDILVYQEHLATQTALRLLYLLPEHQKAPRQSPYSALISCMPGEDHTLVIVALDTFLKLHGWKTFPMGTSLAENQVMEAIESLQPQIYFLSLMMLARLGEAFQLIETIQSRFPGLVIFAGGGGTLHAKALFAKKNVTVIDDFGKINELALERLSNA
jgi:methanogenic corrinoid protein MtbC1